MALQLHVVIWKESSEDDIPSLLPRRTTYDVISLIKMCRKIPEKSYRHHRALMRCGQHWFAMFSDDPPYFDKTTFFSFSSLWKQPCNGLLLAIPFKKCFRLNLGFWFNKKLCNPSTLSVFSKNIMSWWARGDCVFVFLVCF